MNSLGGFAFFAAAGAVLAFLAGRPVLRAARAWSWKRVQGTIVRAYVDSVRNTPLSSDDSGQHIYFVVVKYQYKVDGRSYESKRWSLDGGEMAATSSGPKWLESHVLGQYAEGTPIDVYYDPAEPASSVIKRGLGPSTYLLFGFGMLLVFGGMSQLLRHAWQWATRGMQ